MLENDKKAVALDDGDLDQVAGGITVRTGAGGTTNSQDNKGGTNKGGTNKGGMNKGGMNKGGMNKAGMNKGGMNKGGMNKGNLLKTALKDAGENKSNI